MEKPNAVAHFRGKDRYNCAQAVLKAYASPAGLGEECLARFSKFGGGRAPGGECGALFAAKMLVRDHAAKQKIEEAFVCVAGSKKCREIRAGRKFTCKQCVQTAADVVYLQIYDGHTLQRLLECQLDGDHTLQNAPESAN